MKKKACEEWKKKRKKNTQVNGKKNAKKTRKEWKKMQKQNILEKLQ